jgi:hypothetical protein
MKRALFMPGVEYLWGTVPVYNNTVGVAGGGGPGRTPIRFAYEEGGSTPSLAGLNATYLSPDPRDPVRTLFHRPAVIDWSVFNEAAYFELADAILEYSRKHLTTAAMVSHVFALMGYTQPLKARHSGKGPLPPHEIPPPLAPVRYEMAVSTSDLLTVGAPWPMRVRPKRVLLISREHDDYMELAVENGLNDLGIAYASTSPRVNQQQQVMPRELPPPHNAGVPPFSMHGLEVMRDQPGAPWQYAFGYGYSRRTRRRERIDTSKASQLVTLERDLAAGVYDAVFATWTAAHEDPAFRIATKYLPASRVAVFNGNDGGQACWMVHSVMRFGAHVFFREFW